MTTTQETITPVGFTAPDQATEFEAARGLD